MDLSFIDGVKSRISKRPFNLEFAVTRNCNSRCLMCQQWKQPWNNELSLREIRKIFRSYDGFSMIGITGGEPFLRKDLFSILKIIVKSQPKLKRLFITSNGFLPQEIQFQLSTFFAWVKRSSYQVKITVLISIDGPRNLHNYIRGQPFAYEKAVESLSLLAAMKEHYRFELGTVSTYGSWNYQFYDLVLQELRKLREKFDTEPAFCFVWFGDLYDTKQPENVDMGYLKAVEKDRFKIIKFLHEKSSRLLDARSLFWLFSSRFARDPGCQVIPCEGAAVRFYLDSFGKIHPCIIWEKVVADLRLENYDFIRVFKSPAREILRDLIKKKECPGCYLTCEFIPTMMAHPLKTVDLYLREKCF